MNMRPDRDAIETLLDSVEAEGEVSLTCAGDPFSAAHVPSDWLPVLLSHEKVSAFVARLWAPMQSLLPRTIDLLTKKTSAIALLTTAARPPSLLYLFGLDKSIFSNRGFVPDTAARDMVLNHSLDANLPKFFEIHGGFVDFFSLDGGLLPIAEWAFKTNEAGNSWVDIFTDGGSSLRYDLTIKPPCTFALDTDAETVESVIDLWSWIDDRYATSLEDLGDFQT